MVLTSVFNVSQDVCHWTEGMDLAKRLRVETLGLNCFYLLIRGCQLIFLLLGFLICKVGVIIVPILGGGHGE